MEILFIILFFSSNRNEQEYIALVNISIIVILIVVMMSILLLLVLRNINHKKRKIVNLKEQVIDLQKKIEVYSNFLCEYAFLQENAKAMINRLRSKDGKLGEEYDQMMKKGQHRLNNLTENLFTKEDLSKILGVNIDFEFFTQNDRLFLVMLANDISNEQIAALLNVSLINLKHRKYYLKRKIEKYATVENNFILLLKFFSTEKLC